MKKNTHTHTRLHTNHLYDADKTLRSVGASLSIRPSCCVNQRDAANAARGPPHRVVTVSCQSLALFLFLSSSSSSCSYSRSSTRGAARRRTHAPTHAPVNARWSRASMFRQWCWDAVTLAPPFASLVTLGDAASRIPRAAVITWSRVRWRNRESSGSAPFLLLLTLLRPATVFGAILGYPWCLSRATLTEEPLGGWCWWCCGAWRRYWWCNAAVTSAQRSRAEAQVMIEFVEVRETKQ